MPVLLIHALIWIIITLVVAYVIIVLLGLLFSLLPPPPGGPPNALPGIVTTLIWVVAVLICLWILLGAVAPALRLGANDMPDCAISGTHLNWDGQRWQCSPPFVKYGRT